MSDTVLYERDGAVAIMTLNRPESLNSMNPEMLETMHVVARRAADDPEVRCVVITGSGRAFSAGGDVKGMANDRRPPGDPSQRLPGGGPTARVDALRRQEEISRLLYEMPKPTIAAVNGHAVGAGFSVALAADIRLASSNAKFGTAFARVGFSGDFGGTWLLQRYLGPARAKEMYFMAEVFDAEKALTLGLVSKIVPAESLMEETKNLARRLADGPTTAFARMKDNFTYGATETFGDTLRREAENMIVTGGTADHREASRAFVERREPRFSGQ